MRHGYVRRESLLYVVVAATRPRYCGVLLVAALWLTAALVCPDARLAAQNAKRLPPPPPFAALFPLEEAWMTTLPAPPSAPAARDGSRVYVPLASESLVALDWASGDMVWSTHLKATSAPVTANGVVYIGTATSIQVLDGTNGDAQWTATTEATQLLCLAGTRLVAIGTTSVRAFDATSGMPQWTQHLDDAGEPLGAQAYGDAVIVSFAKGAVRRLALDDGHIVWTRSVEPRPGPPLVARNTVYIGSADNRFYALALKDGKVRWSWRTGGDVTGAAADAKSVYYTGLDAVVRAINPGNGNQKWKRDIGTRAVAPPLALDGSVLVAGLTPLLSGFAPLTGQPQGTFDLPGDLHGVPLVSDVLIPRTVAVTVVLKDGRAYGLRSLPLMFNESPPPPLPLPALPGKPLTRERLPVR
jgi:outer membrane protein assembly factor BamB